MITEHFFGLIQCYSEQGRCILGNQEFNIMLMPLLYLGIIVLAFLLTVFIFIKLGRPSNWFRSYPVDEMQHFDSFDTGEPR